MRRIILTILFFAGAHFLFAQHEFTLHTMRTIPQSGYNNPAFMPKFNTYIGLPGISSIFTSEFNSGFTYNDIFYRREDDSLVVDLENIHSKLKKRNYFVNEQQIDVLSFGFRVSPRAYFNFNFTVNNLQTFEYPKEIMAFIVNGNADYIGETLGLKMNFNSVTYMETGVGLSYQVNDELTVGGRLKYLSGVANINTNVAEFNLFTDEFYELSISGDIDVETSGINQLSDVDYEFQASDINDYFQNRGFALDIGGTYEVNDKISVNASITNLGWITWKHDLEKYELDEEANYTWEGVDIQKLIDGEEDFDAVLDSISDVFELNEIEGEKYNTPVPLRSYISGTYKLPSNSQLAVVLFSEKYKKNVQAGLGFVANKQFGKHFDLSLSYSLRKNTYNNLGAGLSFRFSPFQFYMVSDNILGAPLYLNDIKYFNLRFGFNLLFDWHTEQAILPNSLN